MGGYKKASIIVLYIWLLFSTGFMTSTVLTQPVMKAVFGMAWGLIILWVSVGGCLMYHNRERIKNIILRIHLPWQIKFFSLFLLLSMIEEAVATFMTNTAPLFGLKMGQAYITASANYFDVIFFHSIISFLGLFLFWTLVAKRYDIDSFASFFTFGMTGLLAEVIFSGPSHLLEFGLWIFVYGLMIFLPVYTLPSALERGATRKARFYHYFLFVFLPILLVPLTVWIPSVIDPGHPPIDFPPL